MRCGLCGEDGHRKGSKDCKLKENPGLVLKEPIEKKESNKWTEEQFSKLKDLVISYGLDINWEEVSLKMNRSPEVCKSKYYEIISAKERLEINLVKLNNNEIEKLIEESRTECNECNGIFYCELNDWRERKLCDRCYNGTRNERDLLWEQVSEYSSKSCKFCGKSSLEYSCHFDHLNMFNKTESICIMVNRGDSIEKIKEEIDKCQLICKSCHNIVTIIERKLGFHSAKANITKRENNEGILLEEEKKEMEGIYSRTMEKIYDFLGSGVKGGFSENAIVEDTGENSVTI